MLHFWMVNRFLDWQSPGRQQSQSTARLQALGLNCEDGAAFLIERDDTRRSHLYFVRM